MFGKERKIEDLQENYINGLIFPTTAHFSSFISSRYKVKDPQKHQVKAKLFMFDVSVQPCRPTGGETFTSKSAYPAPWILGLSISGDSLCPSRLLTMNGLTIPLLFARYTP
jgi:hypothetical protein